MHPGARLFQRLSRCTRCRRLAAFQVAWTKRHGGRTEGQGCETLCCGRRPIPVLRCCRARAGTPETTGQSCAAGFRNAQGRGARKDAASPGAQLAWPTAAPAHLFGTLYTEYGKQRQTPLTHKPLPLPPPAGTVHRPRCGSMPRRHSRMRPSCCTIVPTTMRGFW